jgi:hypothetical protein
VNKHCHNCRHWSSQSPGETKNPTGWGECARLTAEPLNTSNIIWMFPPPSQIRTNQHFSCSLHEQQMQVVTRHNG